MDLRRFGNKFLNFLANLTTTEIKKDSIEYKRVNTRIINSAQIPRRK